LLFVILESNSSDRHQEEWKEVPLGLHTPKFITCRPDFAVVRRDGAVAALAAEAKAESQTSIYQLGGQALLASRLNLYNKMQAANFPIPLIQLRGTRLTAGVAHFSPKYLEMLTDGLIPTDRNTWPTFRMFTQQRDIQSGPDSMIVGADLAIPDQRDLALRLLSQAKALAIINAEKK